MLDERVIAVPGKEFRAYWWFVGWWDISFGFHVSLSSPNIEIHLPFGFFRIGWERPGELSLNWNDVKHREFSLWPRRGKR